MWHTAGSACHDPMDAFFPPTNINVGQIEKSLLGMQVSISVPKFDPGGCANSLRS